MKAIVAAAALTAALVSSPAWATLAVGADAPDFTATASLGGKEFSFSLADALKKGPVVLYFYPAAFTPGCTVEAHDFAEAIPQYQALGATVIGVSHDNIATLDKFSVSDCRKKFAVVADPDGKVIKAYDSALPQNPAYANRTSYVIAPDGKVLFTYTELNPDKHVELTMDAVKKWRADHPAK